MSDTRTDTDHDDAHKMKHNAEQTHDIHNNFIVKHGPYNNTYTNTLHHD